jgi:hypothetical protein
MPDGLRSRNQRGTLTRHLLPSHRLLPLPIPSRCHPHRRLITATETTISMMTTAMTMTTTKIDLMMTGTDV